MSDASGGGDDASASAPIIVNPSAVFDQVEGQITLLVNSAGAVALAYARGSAGG